MEQLDGGTPACDVIDALRRDGAVIVRDLLSPEVVRAINDEVQPFVDRADPDMRHLNPGVQYFHAQTRHVSGLAGKSPTFATEVMIHPLLLALCDAILGPSCARYQLNLAHLLERLPGATDQFWHQDELVWNLVPEPKPDLQLASVIALVDFTADNGATRVFPGQSPAGRPAATPPTEEPVVAEMPAGFGDPVSRLDVPRRRRAHRHRARGAACTCRTRSAGCAPRRTTTSRCRPRSRAELPQQCQEVLGYAVHDAIERGGGYLGMLDMRDPVELFAEGWPAGPA